jgi:dephospho-CoA kinase
MIILGITGTNGAGKGTVVDYLVQEKSFKHYSARAFITEEIVRRNLLVNRDNMVAVANDLRAKNSPSFVIAELYKQAVQAGGDCIIESIRTVGEVEEMKGKANFYLLAVDADIKLRYERVVKRGTATDSVSFEEFVVQEEREMTSTDPNKQNLSECLKRADFILTNNGAVEYLHKQLLETLQKITP